MLSPLLQSTTVSLTLTLSKWRFSVLKLLYKLRHRPHWKNLFIRPGLYLDAGPATKLDHTSNCLCAVAFAKKCDKDAETRRKKGIQSILSSLIIDEDIVNIYLYRTIRRTSALFARLILLFNIHVFSIHYIKKELYTSSLVRYGGPMFLHRKCLRPKIFDFTFLRRILIEPLPSSTKSYINFWGRKIPFQTLHD